MTPTGHQSKPRVYVFVNLHFQVSRLVVRLPFVRNFVSLSLYFVSGRHDPLVQRVMARDFVFVRLYFVSMRQEQTNQHDKIRHHQYDLAFSHLQGEFAHGSA